MRCPASVAIGVLGLVQSPETHQMQLTALACSLSPSSAAATCFSCHAPYRWRFVISSCRMLQLPCTIQMAIGDHNKLPLPAVFRRAVAQVWPCSQGMLQKQHGSMFISMLAAAAVQHQLKAAAPAELFLHHVSQYCSSSVDRSSSVSFSKYSTVTSGPFIKSTLTWQPGSLGVCVSSPMWVSHPSCTPPSPMRAGRHQQAHSRRQSSSSGRRRHQHSRRCGCGPGGGDKEAAACAEIWQAE